MGTWSQQTDPRSGDALLTVQQKKIPNPIKKKKANILITTVHFQSEINFFLTIHITAEELYTGSHPGKAGR